MQKSTTLTVNLTPAERLLASTALVALGEFRCQPDHAQFAGGGPQTCHYVVFPRNPVRIHVYGGECGLVSAGAVRFYNIDDQYERASVGRRADDSDWIAVDSTLLEGLLARSGSGVNGRASKIFPLQSAPVSARLYLLQRQLFRLAGERLRCGLGLEEAVINCVSRVIAETAESCHPRPRLGRKPRPFSQRRRRQIAEQAKAVLALDLERELSLAQVAARVNCSSAHLARVFSAHTGRSLHAFRQQIRLHHALDLLMSGGASLSDIAARVGFASHSHMTHSFKRDFGVVPSHLLRGRATPSGSAFSAL